MANLLSPVAVAGVAIILLSFAQGMYTERNDLFFPWGGMNRKPERAEYESRLNNLPMDFGDWIGKDTERELNERVRVYAGIEGRVSRTYRNARTQEEVSVEIVSGHPQGIAAHTPDRCYVANGYTMPKSDRSYTVIMNNDVEAEFRRARFRMETHEGTSRLHIFWSWRTAETGWTGPEVHRGRIKFAGIPAIYKIYVIDPNPVSGQIEADSPVVSFIEEALPLIDAYLAGKKPNGDDAADQETASATTGE